MRLGAVFLVGVVAFAVGAVSIGGAAAASHRAAKVVLRDAATPTWSPDGKQIAFGYVRYRSVKPKWASGPILHPVGYRIVRTSSKPGGAVHSVLDVPHGGCCVQMRWVPGGRILVDPSGGLKSVSVRGGKPTRIGLGCSAQEECFATGFSLSPNREFVAVATFEGGPRCCSTIRLLKLKPGGVPVALPPTLFPPQEQWALAFSPDSQQLVFASTPCGDPDSDPPSCMNNPTNNPTMAVHVPGGTPVPLAQSGIPGAALLPSDAQEMQWSPDGRWIAFVEGQGPGSLDQALEVVSTTGTSAPRIVATCPAPEVPADFSWSPTSTSLVLDCRSPVNWSSQISTVSPDGSHFRDLLKNRRLAYGSPGASTGGPQWSPNGSRLLFLAHPIGHRTVHVWTIRPNGQDLTRVG